MIDGICCATCEKYKSSDCPIETAKNWSKYRDFCSSFKDVNGFIKIIVINTKSENLKPIENLPF